MDGLCDLPFRAIASHDNAVRFYKRWFMAGRLSGKVGLVTGAGGGIGQASAEILAREGARVVVCDVDVAGGENTVQLIRDAGGDALFIKADVSRAGRC